MKKYILKHPKETPKPENKLVPSCSQLSIQPVELSPTSKIADTSETEKLRSSPNEISPKTSETDAKREYSIEQIQSTITIFSQKDEFHHLPDYLTVFSNRKIHVFKIRNRGRGKKERQEFLRTEEFKKSSFEFWRRSRSIEEETIYEKALMTSLKLSKNKEEAEQNKRKVKISLNKISPSNCEKLQAELASLIKESRELLVYFTESIFDKAWAEIKYTEMYAKICKYMKQQFEGFMYDGESPSKRNQNWFRYVLLNTVQYAFEENHDESKAGSQNRDFQRKKAHGSVRFIGELFKVRIVPPLIIQLIVESLIGLEDNNPMNVTPDSIEVACVMISTVGIVNEKRKLVRETDKIFEYLARVLEKNQGLSSQVKFRIMDLIDERKNSWAKDVSEQPKPLDELRNEFQNED